MQILNNLEDIHSRGVPNAEGDLVPWICLLGVLPGLSVPDTLAGLDIVRCILLICFPALEASYHRRHRSEWCDQS